MVLPTTRERVPAHTAEHVNQQIRRETEERVRRLANHPPASPNALSNWTKNGT